MRSRVLLSAVLVVAGLVVAVLAFWPADDGPPPAAEPEPQPDPEPEPGQLTRSSGAHTEDGRRFQAEPDAGIAPDTTCVIEGTIVGPEDAEVTVAEAAAEAHEDGSFVLEVDEADLPATLSAEGSGHQAASRYLASCPPGPILIRLAPSTHLMTLRVVDTSENPIEGAEVVVGTHASLTDVDGQVELKLACIELDQGARCPEIRVRAAGFITKYLPSTLRTEEEFDEGDVVLEEAGQVRGTVETPDGTPVVGSAVSMLTKRGGADRSHTATTLGDGSFTLPLKVADRGPWRISVAGPGGSTMGPVFQLDDEGAAHEEELVAGPPRRLEGRIVHTDDAARGVRGCLNLVIEDWVWGTKCTDAEGKFAFRYAPRAAMTIEGPCGAVVVDEGDQDLLDLRMACAPSEQP